MRVMLKGIERNNNLLRYEILRQPRHGSLSAVEQPNPNRQGPGFVIYSHGDDETSRSDTFIYRVTAPISGQSSTGTVTVRIIDPPPRLGAPALLEFASVVGESTSRNLSLTNLGGGVLRGEVRVRPPFHVDGLGAFELARGRTTRIPLRFVPLKPGLTAPERIQPSPQDDPSVSVALVGEASAPFAVKTTSEEMALKPDDARTVSVELVNLSSLPQEVTITLDPPDLAEAPSILTIPPEATKTVALRIPPERRGGMVELHATFSTPAHTESRKFTAPPVPARLVLLTPAVDFGDAREMPLTVENTGGVEGRFTLILPDGLTTVEGAASFAVPAGQRTTVRLRLADRSLAGDSVIFDAGSGETVRVPLVFAKPEPPATPAPQIPPPPPPPRWSLNEDVQLVVAEQARNAVTFEPEKDGWGSVRLEVQRRGAEGWVPFQPPPPPEPSVGLFDSLHATITEFFARLVNRDEEALAPAPAVEQVATPARIVVDFAEGDAAPDDLWRLTAEPADGSQRRSVVSGLFRINLNEGTLQLVEPPPAPEQTVEPEAPPRPVVFSAVEGIGQQTTRTSALLQITLTPEPGVTGYRLERLAIVMAIDPATGVPRPPVVEPVPHEGEVRILSTEQTRSDGRDLTVVNASISGLPPGMDTAWRLVPLAGGQERPPTKEFFIRTLPPWRFPWRALWLGGAFAFVCVALYLRWRSRQPQE